VHGSTTERKNMSAAKVPYRIGIVGAGNISKLHLDGMRRHPGRVAAVALCDPDALRVKI
jgi:predicted dehydrogenase